MTPSQLPFGPGPSCEVGQLIEKAGNLVAGRGDHGGLRASMPPNEHGGLADNPVSFKQTTNSEPAGIDELQELNLERYCRQRNQLTTTLIIRRGSPA